MHELLHCATSSLTAHHLLTAFIYRFNRQKKNRFDYVNQETKCHQCFDPRLLNELCASIRKIHSKFPSDIASYWFEHELETITLEQLAHDLSLQSGVFRNKSNYSLASYSSQINKFNENQIDAMMEFNQEHHIHASLFSKDESLLMTNLPSPCTYVITDKEKILIDHLLRDPQFCVKKDFDFEMIVKATDFLEIYNWFDLTLAFNQRILRSYKFEETENGLKVEVNVSQSRSWKVMVA